MTTIIIMTMRLTVTKNLWQIKMQFIDTSILSINTITIMIMHIVMTISTTMIIMIMTTATNIMTIIITAKEKRGKDVLLQTCSKIRQEILTGKHSITFTSNSDLSPIPPEL
jgi:hypothetical protein